MDVRQVIEFFIGFYYYHYLGILESVLNNYIAILNAESSYYLVQENCLLQVLLITHISTFCNCIFHTGLDFKSALANSQAVGEAEDVARKGKILFNLIHQYQDSISQLELCTKPVLAAVHSACIGGGVSIITAADVRYCTKDAWFQIKEVLLKSNPLFFW